MNVLRESLREKAMASFLIALFPAFVQTISACNCRTMRLSANLTIAWKRHPGGKMPLS
jgi:hypothetical protein